MRASERRGDWSCERFAWAVVRLMADRALALEWERDSGENWAQVLNGDRVVALVCRIAPIVFVNPGAIRAAVAEELRSDGVEIVEMADLDDARYSASPASVAAVFPDHHWRSETASLSGFSANDLHWMTAT